MSALFLISAVFFAFPLLSPAVGMVLYPFLLQGLVWAARARIPLSSIQQSVVVTTALSLLIVVDATGFVRLCAFFLGFIFFHFSANEPRHLGVLLKLMSMHAWITIGQLLLVMAGVPLDFSEIFRALYGSLLPPTGIHIDYNAFSQFDFFIPRVAGLSREPAFASLLFLSFTAIALRLRHWRLVLLFATALLCTLSKVVFPLLVALALSWPTDTRRRQPAALRVLINLATFTGFHLLLVYLVLQNLELIEFAMALDASFYHRFIGLHTLATQWDVLAWFGNSIDRVSTAPIFASYEFLDDRRAFLDGSVVSKLVIDFGYFGVAVYALVVSLLSKHWRTTLGLGLGGLFINFLSVSPATLVVFWLLCGKHDRLAALPSLRYRPAAHHLALMRARLPFMKQLPSTH